MSKTLNNVVMTQRHNTAATWATVNPVLAKGQIGFETDTNKFKFGDGTTAWNSLPYATTPLPEIVDNLTTDDATKVLSAKQGKILNDNKVDKVSGKGLSTNDYTTEEKNKLGGIAAGAQVNVIETVKVNGTALTPSSKAVNVTVPTKTSDLTNDSTYVTQSQLDSAISSTYKPAGTVAFASLPTLSSSVLGNVYNVSDAFTTTSNFVEGSGKSYPAGTNVAVVSPTSGTYKFDVLAGFVDLSGYQIKIDANHKVSADLIDDTSSTHKFVSAEDIAAWNGIVKEISTQYIGFGNGTDTTTLTYIKSAGIYKLTYNGSKYIYYYGTSTSSDYSMVVASGSNGAVYLFVSMYSTTHFYWYYIIGSGAYPTISYGYTQNAATGGGKGIQDLNSLLSTSDVTNSLIAGSLSPISSYGVYTALQDYIKDTDTLILDGGTDESST